MTIRIQCRGEDGRYRPAGVGEFSEAALKQINRYGANGTWGDGWWFTRSWLCRFCLNMAEFHQADSILADKWIERYRKIREIQ